MTGDGAAITAGGRKSSVLDAAFSPQGTYLATASDSKQARVSEIAHGKTLLEVRHDAAVQAVAFSPSGTRLVTGSTDKSARIWHAVRQRVQAHSVFSPAPPLKKGPLLEVHHDAAVQTVAFSPDGSRLATGSADKTARIWDAATGQKLLEVHHDAAVQTVAFSPDGSRLATGSADNSARIWRVAEREP
jgi:WD40 repeat protein